jgi:serine/threonine protein kinase
MPNTTGETLHERLARQQTIAAPEAVRIGAALARHLVQLHRQGLKDCPISPANIVLRGNDARLLEAEQAMLTRDNLPYTSPEEAAGKQPDELTDIYRLGALMFHMLTGSPPPAPQPGRLRPGSAPPSVHAIRRDISRQLDAAITRALSAEPAARFSRASQFAEILEDSQSVRTDHSPHSDRPSQAMIVDSFEFGEAERREEKKRRQASRRRMVLLTLVVLGAAAAFFLMRAG